MRHAQPWRSARARTLRANATPAEAKLWSKLRNRQLGGLKFVRQAPVGSCFVDFLCRERCVIVEVDGATHGEDVEIAADAERTLELERLGYRVWRAQNNDVFENVNGVLNTLLAFLDGETD